jgi:hypothetical protein
MHLVVFNIIDLPFQDYEAWWDLYVGTSSNPKRYAGTTNFLMIL